MYFVAKRLRFFLAALLTLSLLCGPCLSRMGFVGSGLAHAHADVTHAQAISNAAGQWHDQHVADAAWSDKNHIGHHPVPDNSPQSCEERCDGWAVKKKQRSWSFADLQTFDSEYQDTALNLAGAVTDIPGLPFGHRIRATYSQLAAQSANSTSYALTNRYRL